MMKRKIKVTQDHINKGQPHAACYCPIALAMLGMGFDDIEVVSNRVSGEIDGSYYGADLPVEARSFVLTFDDDPRDESLQPFEFEVDFLRWNEEEARFEACN